MVCWRRPNLEVGAPVIFWIRHRTVVFLYLYVREVPIISAGRSDHSVVHTGIFVHECKIRVLAVGGVNIIHVSYRDSLNYEVLQWYKIPA